MSKSLDSRDRLGYSEVMEAATATPLRVTPITQIRWYDGRVQSWTGDAEDFRGRNWGVVGTVIVTSRTAKGLDRALRTERTRQAKMAG